MPVHDPLTFLLAAAAAVAFLVTVACLAILHRLPTGLHPVRDAVSLYGVTPQAAWYRRQVVAAGIGALLLAFALARTDAGRPLPLALLAVYGLGRIAIAWFPTDAGGAPLTSTGRRHALLAAAAFLAIGLAAPPLGRAIADQPASGVLGEILPGLGLAVGATVLATLAAGSLARSGMRVFGAVERLFYASSLAFLLATASWVLQLAR